MSVYELNQNQMDELKVEYVCGMARHEGRCPDLGEAANAPDVISDDIIYDIFKDITFSPEDFRCSAVSM